MVIDVMTFKVKRGREREFERHSDDWTRLMRRSRGFISQVLMRNADDVTEYRAEVRWTHRDYRDRFNAHEEPEASSLMKAGAELLERPPTRVLLEVV